MEREEFIQQISALRRGELRLEPPEENGLSRFAGGGIYELRQYISALEAGYRKLWGLLEQNMGKVKAGETTLGGLIANQWSDEAALGYAFMACNAAGIQPDKTVLLLEHMGEIMGRVAREDAAAVHRGLIEEGGLEGADPSTACGGPHPLDRGGLAGGSPALRGSGRQNAVPTGGADGGRTDPSTACGGPHPLDRGGLAEDGT